MDIKEVTNVIYDLVLFIGMAIVYTLESIVKILTPRRYREKSIKGEIALVTGGASGIGKLIAKRLADLGARVVIWDINETGMAEVIKDIRATGGKCWGYQCDITSREEVYRTAKTTKIEVGNVTLLINNAGYVYGRTLLELPDEEIERTYKVNVLSHYWITKAFLKDMMTENHGHVVTIASMAGLIGSYKCTDYSGTKFAAIGYHESLLTELKAQGYDGIHATLVCPYLINTGMFVGAQPRMMAMLEPEYVADKIISAILTNEVNIIIPGFVRYVLPFKWLLPAKVYWAALYHVVQGPQSMMKFKGRADLPKNFSDKYGHCERSFNDTSAKWK